MWSPSNNLWSTLKQLFFSSTFPNVEACSFTSIIKISKNIHCVAHSSGNYKLINRLLSERRARTNPTLPGAERFVFSQARQGRADPLPPKWVLVDLWSGEGGRIFKPQIATCKMWSPWQHTQSQGGFEYLRPESAMQFSAPLPLDPSLSPP